MSLIEKIGTLSSRIRRYKSNNINKIKREIMDQSGMSLAEVNQELEKAKKHFGATPSQYLSLSLWTLDNHQAASSVKKDNSLRNTRSRLIDTMTASSDKTADQILFEISLLKKKYGSGIISLKWYYNYGLCHFDIIKNSQRVEELLEKYWELNKESKKIRAELSAIDNNRSTYAKVLPMIEKYEGLLYDTISPERVGGLYDKMKNALENPLETVEERKALAVDMLSAHNLLGFGISEYVAFHLWGKTLKEKREFLTAKEKNSIVLSLTPKRIRERLANKYLTYTKLKNYYDRKMIVIKPGSSFEDFKALCSTNDYLVTKVNYAAFGSGVSKIDVRDKESLPAIFESIKADNANTVVEELVRPHEKIAFLNPSSVNTIRVIVLSNNNETKVIGTSMKIGRAGSFVDNGGAGGILAHIDPQTGIIDTDGIDEAGNIYESHPDHGYAFKGYQLPDWEDCLKTAQSAVKRIKGLAFAGWDLTYNENGNWIIIEGNSMSQFFGQQATTGKGVRGFFLDSINELFHQK